MVSWVKLHPMKQLSTYLFLILFSFQTPSWADDIRDFQIEGISIGDNLLDYYSASEISEAYEHKYKNDKFRYYVLNVKSGTTYDLLQITIKSPIKGFIVSQYDKLIIHSISGIIKYKFNIDDCYPTQDKIKKELDLFFKINGVVGSKRHEMDKTKKSKIRYVYYYLNEDSNYADVIINCYDVS